MGTKTKISQEMLGFSIAAKRSRRSFPAPHLSPWAQKKGTGALKAQQNDTMWPQHPAGLCSRARKAHFTWWLLWAQDRASPRDSPLRALAMIHTGALGISAPHSCRHPPSRELPVLYTNRAGLPWVQLREKNKFSSGHITEKLCVTWVPYKPACGSDIPCLCCI